MRTGWADAYLEDIENTDCHGIDFVKDRGAMSVKRNDGVALVCPPLKGPPQGIVMTTSDKPLDQLAVVVHSLSNKN